MEKLFYPKLFEVFKKGYQSHHFQKDLLAGIIVGIVALPLAIAFGIASGVSPEKGIITAIIAGFIISFLGGSRVQIGGPTGAFIVIVYAIVQQYGLSGLLISTILSGIILILFGVLKLGSVLKYIPHPLVVGFTSGIALIIFSSQVKDALGLPIEQLPSEFIPKWKAIVTSLHLVNSYTLIITLASVLIVLYGGKIFRMIPGSFISIILLTALVQIFHLPVSTIETVFGEISGKITLQLPGINWADFHNYLQPAFTIAMLGAIESLLSAVVADGMISSQHRSNTELIAQGIANVVTPFFGGIPATGAIARTATNIKNGARTPVAGIIHAVTLLLILLFFGKWAKLIPIPVLAGILIVVAYNMSEWRSFVSILRGSRYDSLVLLSTFLLTVLFDLTIAIEIGVVLSALLFMRRMSRVNSVIPFEPDSSVNGIIMEENKNIEIFEISGPFFFAAAKKYQEILRGIDASTKKVIILRMRHVPFIDSTGIHNFKQAIKDLKSKNIHVLLSGVQDEVYKELSIHRIAFLVGKGNIFKTFDEALVKARKIAG